MISRALLCQHSVSRVSIGLCCRALRWSAFCPWCGRRKTSAGSVGRRSWLFRRKAADPPHCSTAPLEDVAAARTCSSPAHATSRRDQCAARRPLATSARRLSCRDTNAMETRRRRLPEAQAHVIVVHRLWPRVRRRAKERMAAAQSPRRRKATVVVGVRLLRELFAPLTYPLRLRHCVRRSPIFLLALVQCTVIRASKQASKQLACSNSTERSIPDAPSWLGRWRSSWPQRRCVIQRLTRRTAHPNTRALE